jgi:outer membrane protein OmpA-like peptidoglycan-associated protein
MKAVFTSKDIFSIRVIGYTDDAGTDAYNLSLSAKRADEIKRLIVEKFRISPSIISAEGKGISTSYAGKSQNRRVEVYIYHG